MYQGSRTGWLEVVSGVMFSGKSEELIRRVRRASSPDAPSRCSSPISTAGMPAFTTSPVTTEPRSRRFHRLVRRDPAPGAAGSQIVAIDEAQFLDRDIVAVTTILAQRGVRVILAGTDTDFRGEPFGAMGDLMAVAGMVDKLRAICMVCGAEACRNQRLVDGRPARWDSPTIMVGGRESYEARCRHCHRVPRADEDQTALL
jgi:thymidine kinase